jgi:hypothetical protein
MTLHIISIILLFAPTVLELFDDTKGDKNKAADVLLRCLLGVGVALVGFFLIGKPILDSFILSMAIHFMFFDYLITFILLRNGTIEQPRGVKYHWFSYTGKSGVIDNIKFWREMKPTTKLFARVGVLAVAVLIWVV